MSTNAIPQVPTEQIRREPAPVLRFAQGVLQVTAGTIFSVTMLASSIVAGGLVGLAISFRNLPDVRVLDNYIPAETTHIYDIKGNLLTSIHDEANREVVPLERISPDVKRAVLAIEDSHFYLHQGINPNAVLRAFVANIEEGEVVEGASTLTMQLVKNLFLTPERALSRKVAEAVLAIRLEQILGKNELLELYLNQVYWGHNTYGVETAAKSYFGKSAAELDLAEAAMMAGLIPAPEEYSPFVNYKLAKQRQSVVLRRMRELNWITAAEEKEARQTPIRLGEVTSFRTSILPYVTDAVIQELKERFGREAVLKGGMRVQTTIDSDLQNLAQASVRQGHQNLCDRGAFYDCEQGQLALVSVDPRTHFVKAMVGGVDFKQSQYNRAVQARRQPGSSFKPFVYYTAFASGDFAPGSTIQDAPVTYTIGDEIYEPANYERRFFGAVTIRRAVEMSLNVPAIKVGQAIGLNKVVEVCRALGIKSPIEPVVSLPLGAIGLTPMEMAGAYSTFATYGWHSEPTFIVQVTDSSGNVLLDNTPKPRLVLNQWAAASMTEVMRGVVTSSWGTGRKANIGRPVAAKSGTTSSERDIWFVGFVPQLTTAIWAGHDNYTPLAGSVTGGDYIAPIWREYMYQALQGVPVENFRAPKEFDRP